MTSYPSMLRPDVFRPLVVTFIPGAIAIFPWIMLLNAHYGELTTYRIENSVVYYFGLGCVAITAGILLEELGSIVEVKVWDVRLARLPAFVHFHGDWEAFLQLSYEPEPVGHRYLRSILLAMKFTTHLMIAIPFALIGMVVTHVQTGWPGLGLMTVLAVLGLLLMGILHWLSFHSCRVLAQTRKLLVEAASPPQGEAT